MQETLYLRNFLDDIGHSVHCMNTIAVSLTLLTEKTEPPKELNISWKPGDITQSSINSRRFAIKSSIIYSAESLFEYLSSISRDKLWSVTGKNFNDTARQNASKAERVVDFLTGIPGINREWIILTELLCHWRNKVVHAASSNANISKSSRQYLLSNAQDIFSSYHHFDVALAIDNFEKNKFTLKDSATLITMAIKCAKAVDSHFISVANSQPYESIHSAILANTDFQKILKQQKSPKKERQVRKWVELHSSFIHRESLERIVDSSK